jgi:hypothetical protein
VTQAKENLPKEREKLSLLKKQTCEIESELEAEKQLALASEQPAKALMKLRAAHRLPAETKMQAEQVRRERNYYSAE